MARQERLELPTDGFGNRNSNQLSYCPAPENILAARFAVKSMLAIKGAVFAAFQTARGFLTVLFGRVIAAAAFSARQSDDFSCHGQYLL